MLNVHDKEILHSKTLTINTLFYPAVCLQYKAYFKCITSLHLFMYSVIVVFEQTNNKKPQTCKFMEYLFALPKNKSIKQKKKQQYEN